MLLQSSLLVGILLLSVAMAYPFKPVKRIDELKIPFCIDQVGYKCNVCGYDDDQKVFTAPNAWNTACLPSVNGCLKYKDLKGEICDGTQGCGCGFIRNHLDDCIVAPTGFQNCIQLNESGTKCSECVSPATAKFGGGIGDYGASFDKTKCLDNTALNKPNCAQYKSGDTECAQCRTKYAFNAAGVCIWLRNGANDNCELANDLGICIQCQMNSKYNVATQNCDLLPTQTTQCQAYIKLPNGLDDTTSCIQCAPGYIMVSNGCKLLTDTDAVHLDNPTSTTNVAIYRRWCLGVVSTFDSKKQCAIPLTQFSDYNKGQGTQFMAVSGCRSEQVDISDLSCPSADDCFVPDRFVANSALFYQKNTKRCITISSKSSSCSAVENCQIADTFGYCETCYDGYTAVNGRCQQIHDTLTGCKEVNTDGVTCQTCYTNYVSVETYRPVYRHYVLNQLTGKCTVKFNDSYANWCFTYDENSLCTKCFDDYELVDGLCSLQKGETPIGQYGCKTFADNKCTEALPGFVCDAIGYRCWPKDTSHNCLSFKADGDCDYCIYPDYYKVYDDVTKKFSKCQNDVAKSDNRGCAQRLSNCNDCEECKATYTQLTRVAPAGTDTGCYRSTTDTGDGIEGCVVHSSNDACTTCGFGYIKTTDNQCFNLYGRRPSANSATQGALTGVGISNIIPEPCKTASTVSACSACQAPGADIGLRKFAAGFFNDVSAPARAYCLYNAENTSIRGTSGTRDTTQRLNCASYKEETSATALLNECETAATGYTIVTGIPTMTSTSDGVEFGHTAGSCKKGSINSTKDCTECNPGYYLDDTLTPKKCETIPITNCRVGTQSTQTCTKCQAGYQLTVDGSASNQNVVDQCHQISGYDNQNCGGSEYKCANKDLTVTFDNTNLTNGKGDLVGGATQGSTAKRAVSGCATLGHELKNSQCIGVLALTPNCAKIHETSGACQSCNAGFILVDGSQTSNAQTLNYPDRSQIFLLKCVPEVTHCTEYNGALGTCKACQDDPVTGQPQFPDDSGSVCVDESIKNTTGCKQFKLNSKTECLECKQGRGVITDGCILNPICATYQTDFPGVCHTCPATYKINYQFECVQDLYGLLSGCSVAYNSTTCLQCTSDALFTNEDNDEAQDIGVCQTSLQIHNCAHYSADGSQCFRCADGYAWLNGICVLNDATNYPLLSQCAEYKYDSDKKQLYCSECSQGYAIDGNYTTCILNTHKCSDISGGSDCSQINLLKPFGTPFECDEYRSSSTLTAFSLLFSIILIIFL